MNELMPLFICGMSRGGTTWLGNCLNEHPDVAVFGESLFWGRNYIEPTGENGHYTQKEVKQVLRLLTQTCVAFLGEGGGKLKNIQKPQWEDLINSIEIFEFTPAELFHQVCLKVSDKEDVAYVIEKTPHHVNWIPRIIEAYPNAKFVIMMREAYGFMLSYKYQGSQKSREIRAGFKALYHPVACAFVWRRYMLSSLEMSIRFSEQTYIVEFDDLKNKSELCWQRVLSFLEIPQAPFIEVKEHNSSFVSERKTLLPVDIFWMNLIAGRAMRKGGYKKKKSGLGLSMFSLSILSLIPWTFRAILMLRSSVPGGLLKYLIRFLK